MIYPKKNAMDTYGLVGCIFSLSPDFHKVFTPTVCFLPQFPRSMEAYLA